MPKPALTEFQLETMLVNTMRGIEQAIKQQNVILQRMMEILQRMETKRK